MSDPLKMQEAIVERIWAAFRDELCRAAIAEFMGLNNTPSCVGMTTVLIDRIEVYSARIEDLTSRLEKANGELARRSA